MKSFILLVSLLFTIIMVHADDLTFGGNVVPDTIELNVSLITVDYSTALFQLDFKPSEISLNSPPTFEFQLGDEADNYYYSVPILFENAIDEDGNVVTKSITLAQLKPDRTYHFNIRIIYLGVEFDSGDQIFKTIRSL